MPNVISENRRSVTYLEDRATYEAIQRLAEERETDASVILREASAAYCILGQSVEVVPNLLEVRAAAKAAERAETARQIAAGEISPEAAQMRNAPITEPVQIVNLWKSVRRYARARPVK